MGEPVGHEQRVELACVAVVKADDKFTTVRAETLQRMWQAGREIPEVARIDIGNVWPPHSVESGHAATAISHDGPLSCLVPMQLSDAACREPHVDASDRVRNREIGLRHLAGP